MDTVPQFHLILLLHVGVKIFLVLFRKKKRGTQFSETSLMVCAFCIALVSPMLRLLWLFGWEALSLWWAAGFIWSFRNCSHSVTSFHSSMKRCVEGLGVQGSVLHSLSPPCLCFPQSPPQSLAWIVCPFYPRSGEEGWDQVDRGREGGLEPCCVLPQHHTKAVNEETCSTILHYNIHGRTGVPPKASFSFQAQGTDPFLQ